MEEQKDESKTKITEVTNVISHQLKSPLAGIKSSLEVLLSGDLGALSPEQHEYISLALNGAEKMIALVKNILETSKIDENRLELKTQKTNITELARSVVRDLAPFAQAKNTSIDFTSTGDVLELVVDPIKIHEVMENIVINAIRYNKGKGTVRVALKKEGDRMVFSCADSGVGISDDDRKKIFTKFYRSPRVIALAPDGSGLGLYISKAIIEKSGGAIWFESADGKGTTFSFSLPIQ